ncbi:MAG: serine hydrolase [Candidatus Staskawiczbacteria bacterium]|nr:serine hydrolase [Candidatus Staskawiczbacteria bacterium]
MNKKKLIILIIIVLIIGIVAGYFWGFSNEKAVLTKKLNIIRPIRENNSEYKFVDPLLAYIIPSADQEANMVSLKNKISGYINANKNNNNLSDTSVFFYDLNRGRWIGVNETEKYSPASMLKVVIMVACLKDSEINSSVLNKYLVYTKNIDDFLKKDSFNTLSDLKIGSSYKTEDLINKMIIDSDNGAKLYSATYLNSQNSEKALDILSKVTFTDGLVAGVSKDTIVAHKFGEHIIQQNNQAQQIELHDCGIIYYPKNPYLLCVMTKGSNLDNLKNTIKSISSLVYQEYKNLGN